MRRQQRDATAKAGGTLTTSVILVKLVALAPGSTRGRHAELVLPASLRGDEPPPCAIVVSLDRFAAFVVPVSPPPAPTATTDDAATTDGTADAADLDVPEPAPVLLTATMLRQRLAEAGRMVAQIGDDAASG